jgi:hypothetical protein
MLPLFWALLLTQDCAKIHSGHVYLLARYIGTEEACEGCADKILTYDVLERISEEAPAGRIRVQNSQLARIDDKAGNHLLSLMRGSDGLILLSHEPVIGNPDEHPFVQRLRAPPPATITVVAFHHTHPLAGVQVTLSGLKDGPTTATTDPEGVAFFDNLPSGKYEVQAALEHYRESRETLMVAAGSCEEHLLDLQAVNKTDGVLTDEGGVPLEDVEISLYATLEDGGRVPAATAVTAQDGSFQFVDVPTGSYLLGVGAMGSSSGTLIPAGFYPDGGSADHAAKLDLQPGASPPSLRFSVRGLGRRYPVEVRGMDPDGRELLWHFLAYAGFTKDGREIASCCQASPRWRFTRNENRDAEFHPREPERHRLVLFEKLRYMIDAQTAFKDGACFVSPPVELSEGSKSNVILRFQKTPCLGSF